MPWTIRQFSQSAAMDESAPTDRLGLRSGLPDAPLPTQRWSLTSHGPGSGKAKRLAHTERVTVQTFVDGGRATAP